jgi:23S rRNA (cytidine1920-2'-O)/16S rRNA (cytidine1409-2'-O)-methyltransferase
LKEAKNRLDIELAARGLAESRQKAQALILAGQVMVDGRKAVKAGEQVNGETKIEVIEGLPYVSRGGLKLKAALDNFQISVAGLVCADIGASTGGFTDCLLKEGAKKVYSVDVGYGLIDQGLRGDPRVKVMERVNFRHAGAGFFDELVDFASVDVSFISLKLILPPINLNLKAGGVVVALVKPQFEVGRERVGKGGIVRDENARELALQEITRFAGSMGFKNLGAMESPVRGAKGNVEYLLYLHKAEP